MSSASTATAKTGVVASDDANKPIIVNKWDTNALKNALDDAIKAICIEKFRFMENHRLMNWKIGLGVFACLLGVCVVLYDWLYPYPASRHVILTCVLLYVAASCALSFFAFCVERNTFLVAQQVDPAHTEPDTVWNFASRLPRFDHVYALDVERRCGLSGRVTRLTSEHSVAELFDEAGCLCATRLESIVCGIRDKLATASKTQ